jgi:hypothetical protein
MATHVALQTKQPLAKMFASHLHIFITKPTPANRVLLEKLIVARLIRKFSA